MFFCQLPDENVPIFFPRVIDGADSTLDAMEKVPVNEKNRPQQEIKLHKVSQVHRHSSKMQTRTLDAGDDPRQSHC